MGFITDWLIYKWEWFIIWSSISFAAITPARSSPTFPPRTEVLADLGNGCALVDPCSAGQCGLDVGSDIDIDRYILYIILLI
jgi:hypothetical protein